MLQKEDSEKEKNILCGKNIVPVNTNCLRIAFHKYYHEAFLLIKTSHTTNSFCISSSHYLIKMYDMSNHYCNKYTEVEFL